MIDQEGIADYLGEVGYQFSYFARQGGHNLERATRPFQWGNHGFELTKNKEILMRVFSVIQGIFFTMVALVLLPFSTTLLTLSSCLKRRDIQSISSSSHLPQECKTISILSLNVCLQGGPFSALTGQVTEPLHEKFSDEFPSRIDALVDFAEQHSIDILCFQEVHDWDSTKALTQKLQANGYSYFLRHPGFHPIMVNSGLFVASKMEIDNPLFTSYPYKDRANVTLGSQQGCLSFDLIYNSKKIVRIFNTHLSYGTRPIDLDTRRRQLLYVHQEMQKEKSAILLGDFNSNLNLDAQDQRILGLDVYQDLCESIKQNTTCRKGHLRYPSPDHVGERVDGAFLKSERREEQFHTEFIRPVTDQGDPISDHPALYLEITLTPPAENQNL